MTRLTGCVGPEKPGQKLDCNPLTIYFFNQNDIILIYKKIGVDPDNLVTQEKPVTRALGRVKITEVDPTKYHSVLVESTRLQVVSSHPDFTKLIS